MAIDDVSFTNLRNEVISRGNLVQQMINYYNLMLNNGQTDVTDFNEGSEIRNLLESFAVDIYYLMEMENDILRNCFVDTATGAWLDKIGLHPFVNQPRNNGTVARGDVTFSIPATVTSVVSVPQNTVLYCSENGLYYITESEANIDVGETSVTVPASCITTGVDGNCQSNTITVIDDSYFNNNTVSVNNSSAFTDGTNYEDDEDHRSRLLSYIRQDDFGSLGYYKRLCESVAGVHDVTFTSATGYTRKVVVNGTTKPTPDAVLLDVLTALSDSNNVVVGHSFIVDKPDYVTVPLEVAVTVNTGMDSDTIKNILHDLFDGGEQVRGFYYTGLNISESISEEVLYGIFDMIDNVISVTITSNGSPVTGISCPSGKVLKLGTVSVTQTVAEKILWFLVKVYLKGYRCIVFCMMRIISFVRCSWVLLVLSLMILIFMTVWRGCICKVPQEFISMLMVRIWVLRGSLMKVMMITG